MSRNEYRRAFIMLRPTAAGYSGHVRLECRATSGSLYFVVSSPGGEPLRAALAGQRGGEYHAAALGELRRDRRGQFTLAWNFDPRAIGGRPLESYAWVVVARQGADGVTPVLVGNLEGSRPLRADALRDAVAALFEDGPAQAAMPARENAPAATATGMEEDAPIDLNALPTQAGDAPVDLNALPTRAGDAPLSEPEPAPAPEAVTSLYEAMAAGEDAAERNEAAGQDEAAEPDDTQIYVRRRRARAEGETLASQEVAARDARAMGDGAAKSAPSMDASESPLGMDAAESPFSTDAAAQSPSSADAETQSPSSRDAAQSPFSTEAKAHSPSGAAPSRSSAVRIYTAAPPRDAGGEAPALSIHRPSAWDVLGLPEDAWPAALARFAPLFKGQAPLENSDGAGYVQVRAALPEGLGFRRARLGLRAEDGRIRGIRLEEDAGE